MKKNYYLLVLFLGSFLISFAQSTTETLPTIIKENTILKRNTTYVLETNVIIGKNVVVRIQEGVKFMSKSNDNSTFLMEPGAKIVANGTYDKPITAVSEDNKTIDLIVRTVPLETTDIVHSEDLTYRNIQNPMVLFNTQDESTDVYANVLPDDF